MSKLTPLDLKHQTFSRKVWGYNSREVQGLLDIIGESWEALLRDLRQKEDRVLDLEGRLEEYKDKEMTLKQTLISAQRVTEDMKASSKREAEYLIKQAELQAEKILRQAHERLKDVILQIQSVKKQKAEFQGQLRGLVETHLALLRSEEMASQEKNLEDVGLLPKSM